MIGTGFLPEMDEGGFILDYWAPTGAALSETDRQVRVLEGILLADPGGAGVHPPHRQRAGLRRHVAQPRRLHRAAQAARPAAVGVRGDGPGARGGGGAGARGAGGVRAAHAGRDRRPGRRARAGRAQAVQPRPGRGRARGAGGGEGDRADARPGGPVRRRAGRQPGAPDRPRSGAGRAAGAHDRRGPGPGARGAVRRRGRHGARAATAWCRSACGCRTACASRATRSRGCRSIGPGGWLPLGQLGRGARHRRRERAAAREPAALRRGDRADQRPQPRRRDGRRAARAGPGGAAGRRDARDRRAVRQPAGAFRELLGVLALAHRRGAAAAGGAVRELPRPARDHRRRCRSA